MCDFCGVYCLCGVYDVNISGVVVEDVEDVCVFFSALAKW